MGKPDMTCSVTNACTNLGTFAFAIAGTLLLMSALSSPLQAADAGDEAAPQAPVSQHYEITDEADTPPVNYRSEQDERYDTPAQRDAEMYAEEFERKRREEQMEERHKLDNLNTLTSPSGTLGGNLGARDAGFPPRAPY